MEQAPSLPPGGTCSFSMHSADLLSSFYCPRLCADHGRCSVLYNPHHKAAGI